MRSPQTPPGRRRSVCYLDLMQEKLQGVFPGQGAQGRHAVGWITRLHAPHLDAKTRDNVAFTLAANDNDASGWGRRSGAN